MMTENKNNLFVRKRKGAALLVVLGVVMIASILALAFLSRSDIEMACGQNMLMHTKVDYLAESALEHAKGLIMNPQEVTGQYYTGTSGQQLESGSNFYYDVKVEPNVAYSDSTQYCNYDITCRAYKKKDSQRTAQSNFRANLRLDQCIAYYCDSISDNQLSGSVAVTGDVFCRDDLTVYGNLDGDVFSNSLTGTVTGNEYSVSDLGLSWPNVTVSDYTGNYSVVTLGSTLSGITYGPYDPVRVCYHSGDLEIIDNVTINAMLIVDGDLVVSGTGNSIIAGKNIPAMLVTGDVKIEDDAQIDIEGLTVINGQMYVNVGAVDVNILGGLFTADGLFESTRDSTSFQRDAVIWGQPRWLPSSGQTPGAVKLNGINDRIEDKDAGSYLNGRNAITISLWIRSDVSGQDRGIFITSQPTGGDNVLGLRYDKNGALGGAASCIKASIKTDLGYTQIESSSYKQTTNWQHLAITWQSGQSMKLYINGFEDTLSNNTGSLAGTIDGVDRYTLGLGSKGQYWDGMMDDVRIYNKALDVNDIEIVKDGGSVTGLIAQWGFDEDGGRTVTITAAPNKTAIWYWSAAGERKKWIQAGKAFYKRIERY